jgi:DNA-directed RNA polymerase specialized sigma24 family protein
MIEERHGSGSDAGCDLEADRLWPQARCMAEHWCAATIRRLERGDGGFYEADDLLQDLYIEFRDTVARWRAEGAGDDTQALWSAWSRRLWGGGKRVLRRRPQHLWAREEEPMDTADLHRAAEGLIASSDEAFAVHEALAGLDHLDAALWSLSALNRQVVYMICLRGQPAPEIARRLGLSDPGAAHLLLKRARQRLGHLLDHAQGDDDASPPAAASAPHVRQP